MHTSEKLNKDYTIHMLQTGLTSIYYVFIHVIQPEICTCCTFVIVNSPAM